MTKLIDLALERLNLGRERAAWYSRKGIEIANGRYRYYDDQGDTNRLGRTHGGSVRDARDSCRSIVRSIWFFLGFRTTAQSILDGRYGHCFCETRYELAQSYASEITQWLFQLGMANRESQIRALPVE